MHITQGSPDNFRISSLYQKTVFCALILIFQYAQRFLHSILKSAFLFSSTDVSTGSLLSTAQFGNSLQNAYCIPGTMPAVGGPKRDSVIFVVNCSQSHRDQCADR